MAPPLEDPAAHLLGMAVRANGVHTLPLVVLGAVKEVLAWFVCWPVRRSLLPMALSGRSQGTAAIGFGLRAPVQGAQVDDSGWQWAGGDRRCPTPPTTSRSSMRTAGAGGFHQEARTLECVDLPRMPIGTDCSSANMAWRRSCGRASAAPCCGRRRQRSRRTPNPSDAAPDPRRSCGRCRRRPRRARAVSAPSGEPATREVPRGGLARPGGSAAIGHSADPPSGSG